MAGRVLSSLGVIMLFDVLGVTPNTKWDVGEWVWYTEHRKKFLVKALIESCSR